jgi:hypothetical protein
MQDFETLRHPLLGELAMSWREEREKEGKNAIYSGHLRLCLQPKVSARILVNLTWTACKICVA